MIINGHISGPSPLLKLLAPPGLPPIDHFYCSPLKRWILGCKPFLPTQPQTYIEWMDMKIPTQEEVRRHTYGIYGIPIFNKDHIIIAKTSE